MLNDEQKNKLIDQYRDSKVWAVVSTWAVDTLYPNLTYDEARELISWHTQEAGRDCNILLQIETYDGPKL